jgi:Zn-dependent M32 family carboxypeptidase
MTPESQDPRDIPILTEAIVREKARQRVSLNTKDTASALISETIKLADSLLHTAVKDIEATLFERVLDKLRAELPELVNRVLAEQADQQTPHDAPDA